MTGDPPSVRSSADIGEPSRRAKPDSGHPVDHLTSSESMEGPMIAPHGGPRWPRPPCRPGGRGLSRHGPRVEQLEVVLVDDAPGHEGRQGDSSDGGAAAVRAGDALDLLAERRYPSVFALACWNSSSLITPRSRRSASRAISSAVPPPPELATLWT